MRTDTLRLLVRREGDRVRIDREKVRERITALVRTAVFSPEAEAREAAAHLIRNAADPMPASIQGLYDAVARGEAGGFTVPALNLRGLTYDVARAVFRVARRLDAGAFIFEIARSEMAYTAQSPREYATCVLGAAIAEGWTGPVFLQGDHIQFRTPSDGPVITGLARECIEAGFFNIDIDASTLVDLSRPTIDEQQAENIRCQIEQTRAIRGMQPAGIEISIGGEIGEVGKRNSTVEEFIAFAQGVRRGLGDLRSMSKVSVQTGTRHGGFVAPDGSIVRARVDFEVHKRITAAARRFGIAGTVQHGASTLPLDLFGRFPESGAVEIHLATQFQNIMFEHLPKELVDRIEDRIRTDLSSEFQPDLTEAQNLYRLRKKSYGLFKEDLWNLSEEAKAKVLGPLEETFETMFRRLRVEGTRGIVDRFVKPVPSADPRPLLARLDKNT